MTQAGAAVALPAQTVRDREGRELKLVHVPHGTHETLPPALVQRLYEEFATVVDEGLTYPHMEAPADKSEFERMWFVGDVILLVANCADSNDSIELLAHGAERDWQQDLLGFYYIKPNYIGRCSHVCNAGFVTCYDKRARGYGRLLAESFLHFAPLLGYKSSVFNLVFVTNKASVRLWDSLGFTRAGLIREAAALKGIPGLVDAIVFQYQFGK